MERDLGKMSAQVHDLLIIGGGISGACLARDAALRGLSVALVEKIDFGHGTTSASSKLIHGGLRYLRNFEFGLVRESLRERRTWETIAPHIVHPLKCLLPVYRGPGQPSKLKLRLGLTVYDWLAFDRNWVDDIAKHLPGHAWLNRHEALELEPSLPTEGLEGALVYFDCQMRAPERLCLEHLIDAVRHGAQVANYTEVLGFDIDHQHICGVQVEDGVTHTRHRLTARVVVNASGPWADLLLGRVPGLSTQAKIVRSKGIHIVTRRVVGDHAIVMESEGGGHFFLLPWRGHTLIGTTDTPFLGDPDAFGVTEKDLEAFLRVVNRGYPAAQLKRSDVAYFYGGLRPLVESPEGAGDGTYGLSRRSEIYDHGDGDEVKNLVSALGGKWTTSRRLAEQLMNLVEQKLDRSLPACTTATSPLPGGAIPSFDAFVADVQAKYAEFDTDVIAQLAGDYGTRIDDLVALVTGDPRLAQRIADPHPHIAAEVVHAVRREMACRLTDVVFRRTGLGTVGHPGTVALERVASLMAAELDWDDDRVRQEVAHVQARYRPQSSSS